MAPTPGSTEIVARVSELIDGLRPDNVDMLKAFHRVQHEYGYVPREAIPIIAGKFNTTPAIVYGTIDFYSEIRIQEPAGEVVEWCSGPACLLKGSMNIRRALEATLRCQMNRTSVDGKVELRLVQCDGTCHLAPLIRHRGRYIGPITVSDAIEMSRRINEQAGAGEADAPIREEEPPGASAPGGPDAPEPEEITHAGDDPELRTRGPRPATGPADDPTREPGE